MFRSPPPSPRRLPVIGQIGASSHNAAKPKEHKPYRGQMLQVKVLARGFEYDDRIYASLDTVPIRVPFVTDEPRQAGIAGGVTRCD